MESIPYLALASALAALALASYFFSTVKAAPAGNDRMVFLMNEIQNGAKAFLKQEYTWVSFFVAAMIILLAIVITPLASVSYLIGAVLSATAGYIGMTVATMANARTTEAAKEGPAKALPVAYRGGAVMGFCVAGLALLGLMFVYLLFVIWFEVDDDKAYKDLWRGEMPLRAANGQIYEYACHEGNYAMANILAGARAEERK